MKRLFSSARRDLMNKGAAGSYLSYAIGEILLVVVGILIALQINSWNENRLDRKRELEYLGSMLADLQADVRSVDWAVEGNSHLIKELDELLTLLSQPREDSAYQRDVFIRQVVYTYWFLTAEFSELTMAQLKSSASLRLIQDQDVRNAMLNYEQGLDGCRRIYALLDGYFHVQEARQKELFNLSLGKPLFAHIEENYLNILEPLETMERLVPEGPYLLDDDPQMLTLYYNDVLFYRTALNNVVLFLKQQKELAASLEQLIHDRYRMVTDGR
jgi:hypothetical protein